MFIRNKWNKYPIKCTWCPLQSVDTSCCFLSGKVLLSGLWYAILCHKYYLTKRTYREPSNHHVPFLLLMHVDGLQALSVYNSLYGKQKYNVRRRWHSFIYQIINSILTWSISWLLMPDWAFSIKSYKICHGHFMHQTKVKICDSVHKGQHCHDMWSCFSSSYSGFS